MQEHVTIGATQVPMTRKASWVDGPYDTHVSWGFVGSRFGELVITRRGIEEKLWFVWDCRRPATPGNGPQLAIPEWAS